MKAIERRYPMERAEWVKYPPMRRTPPILLGPCPCCEVGLVFRLRNGSSCDSCATNFSKTAHRIMTEQKGTT